MKIYVSPHPDDAILSCGGRILNKRKENQVVINVFSGLYEKPTKWDNICKNTEKPMRRRVEEDKKILSEIGVESVYLDFYDNAVYNDIKKKHRPSSDKELISKRLREILNSYLENKKIFFPKGIGHTDHQLISKIGERLSKNFSIYFYEDLPYSIGKDSGCKYYYKINEEILDEKIKLICAYKTQIYGFLELTNTKSVSDFKRKMKNYHFRNNKFCEKYD